MSKKKKSKKAGAKSRSDGAKEIARAQRKLAKAIDAANEAGAKVARRERALAEVLARHGHDLPAVEPVETAIPLAGPATTGNGVGHDDSETSDDIVDVDAVEQH